MSAFVIADKNAKELDTTVFSAEGGDAVMLFTDQKNAQSYLEEANWADRMTVAELDSIRLIEWLLHCYKNGILFMATNPRRSEQDSGLRVSTLEIKAQLEHAGDHIVQVANPEF